MLVNTDYKMLLISALRPKDVELSEDLYRRMGPCNSVGMLNNFFHGLLAQYTKDTLAIRGALVVTESFDEWFAAFTSNVLPFITKRRLPSCTDKAAQPIYQCESKDLIL